MNNQIISRKLNLTLITLSIILLIGIVFRLYKLAEVPSGFFADEASIGVNAYSILTKSVDEYGKYFPIFFQAFGEYKNPIQIYSTVPLIALFGFNEFSIRLTSVIYGILAVISIYLLVKKIFEKNKNSNLIALFSAFFLTISPWAIHFSRVSLEGLMAFVFFTTIGTYFFLETLKKPKMLFAAVICFVFAFYSYFTARIFIPLFVACLTIVYFRFFKTHKKIVTLNLLLLLLMLGPFILSLFSGIGFTRWQQVNIFSKPPQNETIFKHIATNYAKSFSAEFLFLNGDIGMKGNFLTRHSIKGFGELYIFQLPLILLGLIYAYKIKTKASLILIIWIILYPTGSMFTIDNPQATRTIIGVIPFQILSAMGIILILKHIHKIRIMILRFGAYFTTAIIILISLSMYLAGYFISYPKYSSDFWGWQYGAREIIQYFKLVEPDFDNLIMSPDFNSPEIFFKFYAPNNCGKCIVGLPDDKFNPNLQQLFALTPNSLNNFLNQNNYLKFTAYKNIYFPNGAIAFKIGKVIKR